MPRFEKINLQATAMAAAYGHRHAKIMQVNCQKVGKLWDHKDF